MSVLNLAVVKLDLDRRFTLCAWRRLCDRMVKVLDLGNHTVETVQVRRTVKGYHVFLTLTDPVGDPCLLACLQALLGSDGVREALNLRRAQDGRLDAWNVLFQHKAGRPPTRQRVDYGAILTRTLKRGGHPAHLAPPDR